MMCFICHVSVLLGSRLAGATKLVGILAWQVGDSPSGVTPVGTCTVCSVVGPYTGRNPKHGGRRYIEPDRLLLR
jgi:hypothetical protein